MAGGAKGDGDAVDHTHLAESRRLGRAGKVSPVALRHDLQRLVSGKHCPMPTPRVVGMAVRNKRTVHRASRVDVEVARRAVDAFLGGAEELGEAHTRHIATRQRKSSPQRSWRDRSSARAASGCPAMGRALDAGVALGGLPTGICRAILWPRVERPPFLGTRDTNFPVLPVFKTVEAFGAIVVREGAGRQPKSAPANFPSAIHDRSAHTQPEIDGAELGPVRKHQFDAIPVDEGPAIASVAAWFPGPPLTAANSW